jgi:hypothetical protein
MRRVFGLEALRVEIVAMSATVLLGVLGIIIFQRFMRHVLSSPAREMAVLALVISPVYAVYSGFVMTEVPMFVALISAAFLLWKAGDRHPVILDTAGGLLFGIAVGIREQALTLVPAFLWILLVRRGNARARLRSIFRFGVAAAVTVLAPVLWIYFSDPAGFVERTRVWVHAIPLTSAQFVNNVEASLLHLFLVCPGAWLAAVGAGVYRLLRKKPLLDSPPKSMKIPSPFWGMVCCLVLPVIALWRDADVQIHPRYVMVALPAALIFCSSLFCRWVSSRKGPVLWAIVQVLVFGLSLMALAPFRKAQTGKMEFAGIVRESVAGDAMLIAGSYSPILDYYRGIGVRPRWQILWSGWGWDEKSSRSAILDAWSAGIPVYLITEPNGWSYLEHEFLDMYFFLGAHRKERITTYLYRIYPD